jgi:hypothetical protein
MSFNRENVTWQNADGTWNMAFYVVAWEATEEEGDPEWDVEYDYARFEPYDFARNCASPEEAYEVATKGRANPGGTWVVSYANHYSECEQFSQMLRDALAAVKA